MVPLIKLLANWQNSRRKMLYLIKRRFIKTIKLLLFMLYYQHNPDAMSHLPSNIRHDLVNEAKRKLLLR